MEKFCKQSHKDIKYLHYSSEKAIEVLTAGAEGEDKIGYKQQVANIIQGGDAEDNIVDSTDGSKTTKIKDGFAKGKVVGNIVDGGDGDDNDSPDGRHEEPQPERQGKGIERGMVVEMTPSLRAEELDGTVEHSRGGDKQAQGRGIERRDIIEMDDLGSLTQQTTHTIGSHNDDTEA